MTREHRLELILEICELNAQEPLAWSGRQRTLSDCTREAPAYLGQAVEFSWNNACNGMLAVKEVAHGEEAARRAREANLFDGPLPEGLGVPVGALGLMI